MVARTKAETPLDSEYREGRGSPLLSMSSCHLTERLALVDAELVFNG